MLPNLSLTWRAPCPDKPFNGESREPDDGVKEQLLADLYFKMGLSPQDVARLETRPGGAFPLACRWMRALDRWARYTACHCLIDQYAYAMDKKDAIANHDRYCQELRARIVFLLKLSAGELDEMVASFKSSSLVSSRNIALVEFESGGEVDLRVQGLRAAWEYKVLSNALLLWRTRHPDDLHDWIKERVDSKYRQDPFEGQLHALFIGMFDPLGVEVKWTGVETHGPYEEEGEFDFNKALEEWMPTIVRLLADDFMDLAKGGARPA